MAETEPEVPKKISAPTHIEDGKSGAIDTISSQAGGQIKEAISEGDDPEEFQELFRLIKSVTYTNIKRIREILKNSAKLNREVIVRFLEVDEGCILQDYIDKFTDLVVDDELLNLIISRSQDLLFVGGQFGDVQYDSKLIDAFIEHRLINNIAMYKHLFPGSEFNSNLVLRVAQFCYTIGDIVREIGMENFTDLNLEVANLLIERGYAHLVIKNHTRFSGVNLDQDLVNKIVEAGFGETLSLYPELAHLALPNIVRPIKTLQLSAQSASALLEFEKKERIYIPELGQTLDGAKLPHALDLYSEFKEAVLTRLPFELAKMLRQLATENPGAKFGFRVLNSYQRDVTKQFLLSLSFRDGYATTKRPDAKVANICIEPVTFFESRTSFNYGTNFNDGAVVQARLSKRAIDILQIYNMDLLEKYRDSKDFNTTNDHAYVPKDGKTFRDALVGMIYS